MENTYPEIHTIESSSSTATTDSTTTNSAAYTRLLEHKLKVDSFYSSSVPSIPPPSPITSRDPSPSCHTEPESSSSAPTSLSNTCALAPFDTSLYDPATWATLSPTLSEFLEKTDIKLLEWKPILFLIPSRIGIEKINEAYIPHIKHLLSSQYVRHSRNLLNYSQVFCRHRWRQTAPISVFYRFSRYAISSHSTNPSFRS